MPVTGEGHPAGGVLADHRGRVRRPCRPQFELGIALPRGRGGRAPSDGEAYRAHGAASVSLVETDEERGEMPATVRKSELRAR